MDAKYQGFNQAYSIYLEENQDNPNLISEKKLAKKLFISIMLKIWEKMIHDKAIYKAPYGLGKFMIIERKNGADKNGITWYTDWQATREKGELVRKPNLHSAGLKYGCYWDKTLSKIRHSNAYRFKFARGSKNSGYGYRYLGSYTRSYNDDPNTGIYRANIKH